MKLHVNMCMKLERHKDFFLNLKGHKDPKEIETNKDIVYLLIP